LIWLNSAACRDTYKRQADRGAPVLPPLQTRFYLLVAESSGVE
jgi:hypothetical protein